MKLMEEDDLLEHTLAFPNPRGEPVIVGYFETEGFVFCFFFFPFTEINSPGNFQPSIFFPVQSMNNVIGA